MLKTYPSLNLSNRGISFSIARMEDIYDKRDGTPDEPHRHNYFTVVIPALAKGIHNIDFKAYDLLDRHIFFVNEGQVHQIVEQERSVGYAIVFNADFLAQYNIHTTFIRDINLFTDFGEAPPLILDKKEFKTIQSYCEEMITLQEQKSKYTMESISAYLKLLLIKCNQFCARNNSATHETESGDAMLRAFKDLVEQQHKEWHSVKQFANNLHVTPDYLNKVVKAHTGKSAKEHIQNRIIISAKRLLFHTKLSNKEVGYEIGFSEPAHFSSFFKNCTGLSPSAFKKSIKN